MKIIKKIGRSKDIIATIAMKDEYYINWEKYALAGWLKYCEKYDLGLIIFDKDLIKKDSSYWKHPYWQKMLIGDALKKNLISVNNVCYLDTDILINSYAPNIFDDHDVDKISLVSLRKNLPYSYDDTIRKVAFYRNKFYSKEYPLDSSLFISLDNLYKYESLPVQSDEACMGLMVFNVDKFHNIMKEWFYEYEKDIESLAGDQTHMNYEIQSNGMVNWIDYKYQAIWVFEMAEKYNFLYKHTNYNKLVKMCVEASLMSNYFLHFAGSWYESDMWKINDIFCDKDKQIEIESYYKYRETALTGNPIGVVRPK